MKPHKIRSVFSDNLLDPPDWVRELVDYEYNELDIITIVKTYELYLALILKSLHHIHRLRDFEDWSTKVIDESNDRIKYKIENQSIIEIYNFLTTFINNFNWGVYKDKKNTIKCYTYIDQLIRYCFYPNIKTGNLNVGKFIKNYHKRFGLNSNLNYHDEYKFAEGIKILYFKEEEFIEIKLLIIYFTRLKANLQQKLVIKDQNKQFIEKENENKQYLINENTSIIINNINIVEMMFYYTFNNNYNISIDNSNNEQVLNEIKKSVDNIEELQKILKKNLEELYSKVELNITKEELDLIKKELEKINKTCEYKLHYNKPLKFLFLYKFSNFKNILKILIEKGYVRNDENSDHFYWNYKNIKKTKKGEKTLQDGMILLSILFLDFYYIRKKIDEKSIKKDKNNGIDFYEHAQNFFTANECQYINFAFNFPYKIETCKAKEKRSIPEKYIEFIIDLGIFEQSNIVKNSIE